ncbi:MAG: c-type cytochrome [Gemmatimonadaceae bacterium]
MPRPRVAGGDASRGPALILAYGCGSCHVIPGVPMARGRVGPPLTSLADRVYLAGQVPNTADHLIAWIRNPDSVQAGTAMPDLNVTEQHARDIGAYLYTLAGDRLGPPHLFPKSTLPAH